MECRATKMNQLELCLFGFSREWAGHDHLHLRGAGGRAGQGAREGDPVLGELSGLPLLGPPEKYVERLWNCPPGGGQEAGYLTAPAPQ